MAYLQPLDEKDKENQSAPQSSEQVIGGGSGFIQGGGGGSSAPAPSGQGEAKPAGTRSGSFTNLNNYVSANKGADAAMGQKVENVVGNTAKAADSAVGAFKDNSSKAVGAGTVNVDNNIVSALKTTPQNIDKKAFGAQYNATYNGPQDYTQPGLGLDQAYSGIKNLVGIKNDKGEYKGGQVGLAAGGLDDRGQLLRQAYDQPSYTRGENRLDSFLVGAGDEGSKSLQRIQDNYGGYGAKLDNAQADVTKQIAQGRQTTADTQKTVQGAYSNAVGGLETGFVGQQDAVNKSNVASKVQYDNAVTGINSQDQKARARVFTNLGIDPAVGEWMRSQGYDPTQIMTAGKEKKLGDVANGGDIQRYSGLLGLLDQNNTKFNFDKTVGSTNPYDVDAGKSAAATGAYGIESSVQKKLAAEQKARASQLEQLNFQLGSFDQNDANEAYRTLGISQGDADFMRANNIDPRKYIKAGEKLSAGDIANANEVKQYIQYMTSLGLTPSSAFTSKSGSGSAYSVDKAGLSAAIAAKRVANETPAAGFVPTTTVDPASLPGVSAGGGKNEMSPDSGTNAQNAATAVNNVAAKADPGVAAITKIAKKRKWI